MKAKKGIKYNMRNLKCKILLIILICYLLLKINLSIYNNILFVNILNPIFWSVVLIFMIYDIKNNYIRVTKNKQLYLYIFLISCIEYIIYFYIWIYFGFEKSPYSHDLLLICKNVIIQILPIIGIEIARFIIIKKNKRSKSLLILFTILLILIEINYQELSDCYFNKAELFRYSCSTILPLIANSLLYTYITLKIIHLKLYFINFLYILYIKKRIFKR